MMIMCPLCLLKDIYIIGGRAADSLNSERKSSNLKLIIGSEQLGCGFIRTGMCSFYIMKLLFSE